MLVKLLWSRGVIRNRNYLRCCGNRSYYSVKEVFSSANDKGGENWSRFWMKTFSLHEKDEKFVELLEPIKLVNRIGKLILERAIIIPKSDNSLLFIPNLNLYAPLSNSVVQTQHVIVDGVSTVQQSHERLSGEGLKIVFFGFAPRAQHLESLPEDTDRVVHEERRLTLNKALEKSSNILGEDLLGSKFAGTPPSKMYRSFIAPRKGILMNPSLANVERAAERTANQIEMALRQLRADEAEYLRNTDKSAAIVQKRKERSLHPVALVLDNLRSALNVGSIFRTAETAGIQEVVTAGITAHPPNPKLKKTALSAVELVPSRHFDDILSAIQTLKNEGYTIIAMETTSISKQYHSVDYSQYSKTALILGNEITGVDPRIMEKADLVVEIPTYGTKNSLNVGSAASIVLFEILRQRTTGSVNMIK
jgi:23S rRNA (guanosine2251-2'-O)-methyltransferase